MASVMRPMLLRQAVVASSRRTFASTTSAIPAFRSQLQRQSVQRMQRAAFQTTAQRMLLPPLPQKILGTVNDPVKVHDAEPAHGSYHWSAERALSVAIIPLTVAPFAAGALNPLMDGLFIATILIHSHMGFQQVITDYLPSWRVPRTRKLFDYGSVLAIFVVGWGWYEFETNDVGLTAAIQRIWTAKPKALDV